MNEKQGNQGAMSMEDATPEQIMTAIFANMVMQISNMAAMFLGRVPHPQTGQPIKDLENAQMFIDQLEMLAYKTRGNLDDEEKQLMQQNLTALRMVFVEELRKAGVPVPDSLSESVADAQADNKETPSAPISAPAPAPKIEATPAPAPAATAPTPAPAPTAAPAPATPTEEESRKRFSKKY
jgi:hypothetical protein